MKIRPLYDRIVVKRIDNDADKTAGGLYIPDSAKEKPQEGEVVAVGKGKRLEDGKVVPLDVQPGDRILFGKYSGSEIKLDGGVDSKSFFDMLLQNTKEGYFSDPIYGGNKDMAAWKMIGFPGAHYDYKEWVQRHGERVPFPPVGFKGRPGWTES